jgi:hypothetical protein
MGKYSQIETDIFSIFDSVEWKALSLNTYPSNFIAANTTREFIRVSIIPSGSGINLKSSSGVLQAEIFIASGAGPKRVSVLADHLDEFLAGKSKLVAGRTTQFLGSSLSLIGTDPKNSALYKALYTIPFNHFGSM